MKSLESSVLVQAVNQKIGGLRELLREFQQESARNVSEHFLRGVEAILDAVEVFHQNRLKHCEESFATNPDFQDEQKRFYSHLALQILAKVHENYLPLLYASRYHNEYLVKPSIERALSLFQPDVELTLVPSFEYNFMYYGGLEKFVERTVLTLESYLDNKNKGVVSAVLAKGPQHPRWITFIHFPLVERDSALNLVILIHELGHLVDQVKEIYKSFLPIQLDRTSYKSQLETLCKLPVAGGSSAGTQLTFETVFTRAHIEAQFSSECISTVQSWVREVIADLISIHALGPAYFFAFSEILAHGGLENVPTASHPAPAYRMKLLLDELRSLGYLATDLGADKLLTSAETAITEFGN